jgi:hypothetical protein
MRITIHSDGVARDRRWAYGPVSLPPSRQPAPGGRPVAQDVPDRQGYRLPISPMR